MVSSRTIARQHGLVALALVVAYVLFRGWGRRWVADDAFVDLRVVQNLLAGDGPVFNRSQRVEAFTNPLWVFTLALFGGGWKLVGAEPPLEWLAVILGLVSTGVGLASGGLAALARLERSKRDALALPLGAIVFGALAVTWDFATSGLETGMIFAWLGLCQLGLVRFAESRASRARALAVLLGLGPLVRPDLALFSAVFAIELVVLGRGTPRRTRLGWIATAGALPLAYEIFRAGYFGALVPTTALAKEAMAARWHQGLVYLRDFVAPYDLVYPIVLVLLWCIASAREDWRERDRDDVLLTLAPIGAAIAHGLYVVRVGGDFMHGRLLLPSLFALLLPVMVIGARQRIAVVVLGVALVPWAALAIAKLRVGYGAIGPDGIANERAYYVVSANVKNPVTLADHARNGAVTDGVRLAELAARQRALLLRPLDAERYESVDLGSVPYLLLPLGDQVHARVVVQVRTAGLHAYAAGPTVFAIDMNGLTDPFTSRLLLSQRGRPGHEKVLPNEWMLALYGAPGEPRPEHGDAARVDAARTALDCADLRALRDAVEAPMSVARFASNVRQSLSLTRLRIPADPEEARRALCPPSP